MIKINLAPTRSRQRTSLPLRAPSLNLGVVFIALYAIGIAGVGATWWALTSEQARLQASIAEGNKELTALKAVTSQAAQVKAQLAELKQRVATLNELIKNQSQPIRLVDAFADVVPNDVWITGIEEKAMTLKVTGAAFSTTAVSDLMSNLRKSGRFKEVDIVVARQDLAKNPSLVTFEVTCRFDS